MSQASLAITALTRRVALLRIISPSPERLHEEEGRHLLWREFGESLCVEGTFFTLRSVTVHTGDFSSGRVRAQYVPQGISHACSNN